VEAADLAVEWAVEAVEWAVGMAWVAEWERAVEWE
jgi:hypothetical protein